mmetsp:Transcript_158911/g.509696  ORF Transcript_158911/g.509696 Transcript_158911/m.509696 type:complete len:230 (+) Transcript_158911:732-1421(+)
MFSNLEGASKSNCANSVPSAYVLPDLGSTRKSWAWPAPAGHGAPDAGRTEAMIDPLKLHDRFPCAGQASLKTVAKLQTTVCSPATTCPNQSIACTCTNSSPLSSKPLNASAASLSEACTRDGVSSRHRGSRFSASASRMPGATPCRSFRLALAAAEAPPPPSAAPSPDAPVPRARPSTLCTLASPNPLCSGRPSDPGGVDTMCTRSCSAPPPTAPDMVRTSDVPNLSSS